jgi:hypothetical protein
MVEPETSTERWVDLVDLHTMRVLEAPPTQLFEAHNFSDARFFLDPTKQTLLRGKPGLIVLTKTESAQPAWRHCVTKTLVFENPGLPETSASPTNDAASECGLTTFVNPTHALEAPVDGNGIQMRELALQDDPSQFAEETHQERPFQVDQVDGGGADRGALGGVARESYNPFHATMHQVHESNEPAASPPRMLPRAEATGDTAQDSAAGDAGAAREAAAATASAFDIHFETMFDAADVGNDGDGRLEDGDGESEQDFAVEDDDGSERDKEDGDGHLASGEVLF